MYMFFNSGSYSAKLCRPSQTLRWSLYLYHLSDGKIDHAGPVLFSTCGRCDSFLSKFKVKQEKMNTLHGPEFKF
jgi:hypothetical protein